MAEIAETGLPGPQLDAALSEMKAKGDQATASFQRLLDALALVEQRARDAQEEARAGADELRTQHPEGPYTLYVTGLPSVEETYDAIEAPHFLQAHAVLSGMSIDEWLDFNIRVEHVGPQPLLKAVALVSAVRVKEALEVVSVSTQLKDDAIRAGVPNAVRTPIPESVRHEVWRRDGGQCVDCGSRERLEFDHIIPISKGGSNTARNIELRCESCNRKKGARV
jgi:5-methylcytosine-specific restriction endonuclease McrA